ncbi:RNA dependent RNA polymerase-domain-containing protein [Cokeromyces recurvatus]|uniref:RNA dependent RNA polymerase-domain-containing protein n=1 Tax=Cokeromyces recurvatus TaxID=90255 RepID=UPI0022204D46|nr:RNA dependent RNA polymerase-domain-containing protein [Cokeromyces recurvatus]KAI7904027.1 RNA dependent RNA polymerase-domain-containing protein [Cokeromyces recurvatus]
MDEMVQDVNMLLNKPEEAVRVLLGNVDEAGTALSMVPIIQAGFLARGDPYIKNLLNLFRVNVLKDLKKKAKIIVPKGAYLLGVMDETNTLKEGEVFVQIYDTSNNGVNRQVITGDVVVFRNPCFHPGDVRVVKAVDKENLRHLVNVIAFPSQGYRDIPSMCSGGDLDGDDYTIYWDPRLLPPTTFTPMEYKAAPPQTIDEVKIRDIIKFFVNYISNDNLGSIANAHLATADISPHGARDGKCMLLAQLHSDAVDFPKSGRPAKFTPDLRVHMFPDFMQKKDKPSYQSKKVLGRIFRAIDKSDYKNYKSTLVAETVYDTRLRLPEMEMYIAEARQFRLQYNRDLQALMNQFGVQTEAELCSGFIIKWANSRGRKKSDYEHHQYTMKAVKSLKATWKKRFEEEFYDSNKAIDITKRNLFEAKAAAWYYVAYHPNERSRDMSIEGGFFSFPWCIFEYLCEIAKRAKHKDLEIDEATPISEEKITEGNIKLMQLRSNSPVIMVDNDEESEAEDEYEEESESEESDDEEIISYNALTNSHYYTSNTASRSSNHNDTVRGNNPYAIVNSANRRPLNSQQPVVSADASEAELVAALLGTKDL